MSARSSFPQLSERAHVFFDREHIFRDLSRSCSFERFAKELDRLHVPWFDQLFALEEQFGGLVRRGAHPKTPTLALGLFQLICLGTGESDKSDTDKSDPDEPDESVIVTAKWPMARHIATGEELVHVGLYTTEGDLYMSEPGAIFLYLPILDRVDILSGSPRTFLERIALEDEMRRRYREYAGTYLFADIGETLAHAFGLSLVDEASDALTQHWGSDQLFVSRLATSTPSKPDARTRVISENTEQLLTVIRRAREENTDVKISVEAHLPGGRARRESLKRAGITVE